jgi:hypothetical protein
MPDAEETANRILDTYELDLPEGDAFDQLCDIIEEAHEASPINVARLCRGLGDSDIPDDVILATLQTLLSYRFHTVTQRVKLPDTNALFNDLSLGVAKAPQPDINLDDVVLNIKPRKRTSTR